MRLQDTSLWLNTLSLFRSLRNLLAWVLRSILTLWFSCMFVISHLRTMHNHFTFRSLFTRGFEYLLCVVDTQWSSFLGPHLPLWRATSSGKKQPRYAQLPPPFSRLCRNGRYGNTLCTCDMPSPMTISLPGALLTLTLTLRLPIWWTWFRSGKMQLIC